MTEFEKQKAIELLNQREWYKNYSALLIKLNNVDKEKQDTLVSLAKPEFTIEQLAAAIDELFAEPAQNAEAVPVEEVAEAPVETIEE